MTPDEASDHFDKHFPRVVEKQLKREEEGAYEKLGVPEELEKAKDRVRRSQS